MLVRALQLGFWGNTRRRAGEVFEVPDGTKAKWFAPESETKAPERPKRTAPVALSQLGKELPKGPIDLA
jgi:hypothetical protein